MHHENELCNGVSLHSQSPTQVVKADRGILDLIADLILDFAGNGN
jgi:hypothetical protein